jgi:hypothetical protein
MWKYCGDEEIDTDILTDLHVVNSPKCEKVVWNAVCCVYLCMHMCTFASACAMRYQYSVFNPLKTEFLPNYIKVKFVPQRKHITSPQQRITC